MSCVHTDTVYQQDLEITWENLRDLEHIIYYSILIRFLELNDTFFIKLTFTML